jgi:maltooligosyltrehalose synthase
METPHRTPLATYRFQLRAEATLETAREVLPYLRLLGISELYLSLFSRALPEPSKDGAVDLSAVFHTLPVALLEVAS